MLDRLQFVQRFAADPPGRTRLRAEVEGPLERLEAVSEEYDMVFSSGYGSIGEESFRIGHMGEHTVKSIRALTDAIEDVAGL